MAWRLGLLNYDMEVLTSSPPHTLIAPYRSHQPNQAPTPKPSSQSSTHRELGKGRFQRDGHWSRVH